MKTDLLVIIVTYNGSQWIERCIASVINSSTYADIFVVDNGSTDGTVDYLKDLKEKGELELFIPPTNIGFGAANNVGFEYAIEHGYKFVYLLNQDAWVERGTLAHLKQVISEEPNVAILSPMQMQADGKTMDKQFKKRCWKYIKEAKANKEYQPLTPVDVPFVMAAHWMMRIETIKKFRGFGRVFYLNGEDDDFCNRVRYKDMSVAVLPCVFAVHDRGNRKLSRDKKFYLKYMGCVAYICDPENQFPESLIQMTVKLTLIAIFRFSFKPFVYIKKLWGRAGELARYRRETRIYRMFKS